MYEIAELQLLFRRIDSLCPVAILLHDMPRR